jgi:UDP-4-amino-4,6-dideoxy-N-acetyl-beta-L-altrosamine transaminase
MIPYARQDVRAEDIEAVVACLRSDWLTQGPAVPRFEAALAAHCGARHAVAVSSGTAALHLACLALGLGPGDGLWTSPITFVASANCALYCGAQVDFVDIDPATGLMSVERLAEKLAAAERAGRLPKIVVPVHFAGASCDMAAIHALAQRYGFRIIEDAAHALGGRYQDEPVGACRYSDITIFSFHPVKLITTGEGGMALTNDATLARKMALLRSHGITRAPEEMSDPPEGPWYYQQVMLGFNYRLTDFQAALGLSQFARLDDYIARRTALAARYDALLADLPIALPVCPAWASSAWHLYVIHVASERRRRLIEALHAQGIHAQVHYIPVHRQPWYRRMGFAAGDYPAAEAFYAGALSLPLFPTLAEAEQDRVVAALERSLEMAGDGG